MKHLTTLLIMSASISVHGQNRYFTKTAVISFTAGTAVEDIEAVNKSAAGVLDRVSGQVEVAVLIKGFEFRRGLMQEHFNENYMESEKFPKAIFKGKIDDPSKINFAKDGTYSATASGTLEIHGVKKEVGMPFLLTISAGQVITSIEFQVKLEEYQIKIPGAVKDKISPVVLIKMKGEYQPL